MDEKIAKLKEWIDGSDNIVFFGGAGVSTESGIPDFRSVDGLYNQQYKYPPETILSHTFFLSETEEFYRFYRAKMLALDAKPNAALHFVYVALRDAPLPVPRQHMQSGQRLQERQQHVQTGGCPHNLF